MIFYDPPSGWMHGFPRQYSPLPGESLKETLIRDGYPECDAQFASEHTRFWEDLPEGACPECGLVGMHKMSCDSHGV